MPDNGVYGWSTTADSNDTNADSTAGMQEGIAAALVNNRYRGALARLRAWLQTLGGAATNGGTGNAYTLTSPSGHALLSYVDGIVVGMTPNATNTGAATLNVDTLGALAIQTPSGAALVAGDLVAGGTYLLRLKTGSPNVWHLISNAGTDASTGRANTWGQTQTFSVAPVFTDQAGTRTALSLGSAALLSATGTIYTSSNLPGTSLVWTASQTLGNLVAILARESGGTSRTALVMDSSNILYFGDANNSARYRNFDHNWDAGGVANSMTLTTSGLTLNTAAAFASTTLRNTIGFWDVNDGTIRVVHGSDATTGLAGSVTNHDYRWITNNVERMRLSTAGVLTIGGNTAYHAGNLPGTAINWTATQTFSGTGVHSFAGDIQINKATAGLDLVSSGTNITNIQLRNASRYDDIRNTTSGLSIRVNTTGTIRELIYTPAGELYVDADFAPTNVRAIGYLGTNRVQRSTSFTLGLSDAGRRQWATATITITIPPNSSVAFPVGTIIPFFVSSGFTLTVARGAGVSLYRTDGSGTNADRTLSAFNVAYIEKITADEWLAVGFTG